MATNSSDTDARTLPGAAPSMGPDARGFDGYASIAIDDEDVIIYHRDLENGWLQSDVFVPLDDAQ